MPTATDHQSAIRIDNGFDLAALGFGVLQTLPDVPQAVVEEALCPPERRLRERWGVDRVMTRNRLALGILALALTGCGQSLPASPVPTASPSAATEGFGSADLSRIVLTEHDLGPGMTLDDLRTGLDALLQPLALEETELALQPGFVDARMTRIGTTGQDSYWEVGGYVTWAAVYENDADAAAAFDVLVTEHTSESGWGMEHVGTPTHGDEGVTLEGAAYGWDENLLHIWRDGNLLLAAGALGITATEDDVVEQLGSIAEDMEIRASTGEPR